MSAGRIRSPHVNAGCISKRSYTLWELRAAERLGLARREDGEWSGPLFWASGNYYPDLAEQKNIEAERALADSNIVLRAIAREWDNLGVTEYAAG